MLLRGFPEFWILNINLSNLFSLIWPVFHFAMNWKKGKKKCLVCLKVTVTLVYICTYLTLFGKTKVHLSVIYVTFFQPFNFKFTYLKSYKYCRTSTTFKERLGTSSVKSVRYWLLKKKNQMHVQDHILRLTDVHWFFAIWIQLQRDSW